MKQWLKIAVTVTLLAPVLNQGLIPFNTDEKCKDCCGSGVSLFGRVKLCAEKEWCKSGIWAVRDGQLRPTDWSGTEYEDATFARIFPNGVSNSLRRCTIQGFPRLDTILADMQQITVIERNAFWNLPGLKHIHLSFNSLKEIRYGVFSSLPAESIDLSWNEIGYISETAFKGMNNLMSLNITHNRLTTLDLLQVNFPLQELLASYNYLEDVAINPEINVTVMDLSFNKIQKFNIRDSKVYKLIDLTGNALTDIILGSSYITNLKLGLNNLTDITPLISTQTKIKNIMLFPNPFHCDGLNTLLEHLTKHNVNILKPNTDNRLSFARLSCPVCAYQHPKAYEEYEELRPLMIKHEQIPCMRDGHCASFMICRNRKCWEPCSFGACKKTNLQCQTKDHMVSCRCPPGQFFNETQPFSPCYGVCFQDSDCLDDEYCNHRNVCWPSD